MSVVTTGEAKHRHSLRDGFTAYCARSHRARLVPGQKVAGTALLLADPGNPVGDCVLIIHGQGKNSAVGARCSLSPHCRSNRPASRASKKVEGNGRGVRVAGSEAGKSNNARWAAAARSSLPSPRHRNVSYSGRCLLEGKRRTGLIAQGRSKKQPPGGQGALPH
jgi:hypothetical protein